MEVIVVDTPVQVASEAASHLAGAVLGNREAVLGFATGSSPAGIYAELSRRVRSGELDFSGVTGFALDEYVGLGPRDARSYAATIDKEVTTQLGIRPERMHVPDGTAKNLVGACAEYEAAIVAAGGVNVQLLGLGANGHIGFNEPTSSFGSRTRVKTLAPQTIADNARFFPRESEVPTHCVTQGLGTIMDARHVVLVAQGRQKAAAIAAVVEGPVSSMCPGSILQAHPAATVIIDRAAASGLTLLEYYKHVQRSKPLLGMASPAAEAWPSR